MEVVDEAGFDFILANITRNVIAEMLPAMTKKLGKSGLFLLSGLLAEDRQIIEGLLRSERFRILSTVEENEWIGLAAGRIDQ